MRSLFYLCCIAVWTLIVVSPSFATDLPTQINTLETEVSTLSGEVCSKTAPTSDNDKALFNAQKALLTQAAKNLVDLLNQEEGGLVDQSLSDSDKDVLKKSIESKKKSLQADCPSVPAPSKAATTAVPAAASTLYTLGVAGLNAMGTSASGPSQQYFASFSLLTPLPFWHNDNQNPLNDRLWAWFDPRIASVPSANSAQLSSLSSSSSLTTGLGTQKITDITQSFEFQGGLELYPIVPDKGAQWGSAKTTFSFVVGFGVKTPFNSASTPTEFGLNANLAKQFQQNPSLVATYPNLAAVLACFTANPPTCSSSTPPSQTTVAFVFPNRSRFYRDWFGGIRLRTFYYGGDQGACPGKKVCDIYPGTFDIRVGEDETVTSGHLVPLVMTLAGSYPLPGTQGVLRIFGETHLRLKGNQDTPTLAATPSSTFTAISDPSVVVQPINPADTDYYRLGLGIDIVPLISKWINSSKNPTAQPSTPAPSAAH